MSANPTIYCLEAITDYFEFERLCHDLMSLEGYNLIEPLGGFSDKGRDAIHVNKSNETTIFAYSVREDWRAKLAEDAEKVRQHNHSCNHFVFITTAKFTSNQRDEAVAYISDEFGWRLDLFGLERLRMLLDKHPHIKKQYPGIFPPALLSIQNQLNAATKPDHLFISCVPQDGVLADWLTRKLTAEGYNVWCERFKLLGGETYPNDVDDAIKNRTFRFLGLYSQASLKNPEVTRQRLLALNIADERNQDFLIPLDVDGVNASQLDQVTSALKFIPFKDDWAGGLKQLLEKLKSINCPQSLPQGRQIAAETFLEKDPLSEEQETLFSNCFRIHQIPRVIHRFKTQGAIPEEKLEELRCEWSHREVNPNTFLSFHEPPTAIIKKYKMIKKGGAVWLEVDKIDGIWSPNLVSELIKKALIVRCCQKGLKYWSEKKQLYFPPDLVENNRLKLTRPDDGSETFVLASGRRTYGQESEYLYSLSPNFFVIQDFLNGFTVLIRIRVYLSDIEGKAFTDKRTIDSRRKYLCKNWWNKDWFNRTLAVSQFLADGNKIIIGEQQEEQIIVDTIPFHLNAPIGINEDALGELSDERLELLRIYNEYLDEDIDDAPINDTPINDD